MRRNPGYARSMVCWVTAACAILPGCGKEEPSPSGKAPASPRPAASAIFVDVT